MGWPRTRHQARASQPQNRPGHGATCPVVLTFLHGGVQLRHLDDQQVHPLLQRVHPHVEAVGLIEQLPKDVLSVPACRGGTSAVTWHCITHGDTKSSPHFLHASSSLGTSFLFLGVF